MLFVNLKLSRMPREVHSEPVIITLWTLPIMQTPFPPAALCPPHQRNTYTHQILLMPSAHCLGITRVVSNVIAHLQGIVHLRGSVRL